MSVVLLLQVLRGWDRWGGGGVVHLNQGVGGETGGWYHLIVFFLILVPLYFVVSGSQSLF